MTLPAALTSRTFHTPAFRIELDGRGTGRAVIADVLEVSFTDDLDAIDSFELTLHDWDPVAREPRYSSPWDEQGNLKRLSPDSDETVPAFDPGAKVALYLGYLEDGELPLVMVGEVVSLTPSFPAGGVPSCRVRALDVLQLRLQRTEVAGNYSGTGKEVVDRLCAENDVAVRWATLDDEGKPRDRVEVDGTLYDAIAVRVREVGFSMFTVAPATPDGEPVLYLARPAQENDAPVVAFEWGRSLVSFSPVLSTAGQVAQVAVRGADPTAKEGERAIEVVRSWADAGLVPSALGPVGVADIDSAVGGIRETITPDGVESVEDAEAAALARLRELARTLVTGSGSSIGLPELRAGQMIRMAGVGDRFNGAYRLTRTVHSLGGSGYTTTFDARKEVLG
jgi:phage protein D